MENNMKFWLVKYDGLWLGGTAVVVADSKISAIEAVAKHENTLHFEKFECEEIEPSEMGVLYNDNGNY